ncbi:hypothetical protein [Azospirillum sp. TSO22-1]|uniref:sensor histidine kinase n=1 Tax=Azospirillum sp. TSO22-1 TaxID=716789 RepID=UPI000D61A5B7|nr:hypothetical protein [Azospirillum sp. TSO22-1]PWC45750.1 hypothetical protein TSO221_15935 [Azospirillum sp. TSO22-1]
MLVISLGFPAIAGWFVLKIAPPSADEAALYIREAAMTVPGEGADQPATASRMVELPYRCPQRQGADQCAPTLRIVHRHQTADDRLTSLYIPSFRGKVTVFLNGAFVATSEWQQSAAESWTPVPMLIPLPSPLLRSGDNEFLITLAWRGTRPGFLDRVAVGPDTLLRPDHNRRTFLFSTLPRLVDGWQVAMGLGMLIMWAARPRETIFLLVGAVLLFQTLSSLPALLGDILDDDILYLANHGRFVSGSLVLPLAWLFVGRRPPVPIWIFLLLPAGVFTSFLTLPAETHQWLMARLFIPAVVVGMLGAVAVVFRVAFLKRNSEALLLFGSFLLALVFIVHDWFIFRNALNESDVLLTRFVAPLVMASFSAVFMWRFAATMNTLDRFNAHLKREVAAAEEALRHSFEREQAQAQAAVLEAERVRLMSDLHDGIAGHLVSILSLCELQGTAPNTVADTVRAALADLRLIVASLDDYGEDLGVMLALFRERIEPQVTAQGMTLVWRMAPTLELKGLHPGGALAIYRILQEATTNAVRHSGSETLLFEAGPSPAAGRSVRLSLRDHGRGGATARPGSYGMGNMRRRAEGLGAVLAIESGAAGTTVILDLPTRLP